MSRNSCAALAVFIAMTQFAMTPSLALAQSIPMGRFVNARVVLLEDRENAEFPSVSTDDLTLYFSAGNRNGVSGDDLFQATRESPDDVFKNAVNLGFEVNSEELDAKPHISADGLRLYFDSQRPGGYGSNDLFMASREDASEPFDDVINLGPGINSEYVEAGVFVAADELTAYFHSDRPGTNGDRDLYQASRTSVNEPFGNVTSLGSDVNTSLREMSPAVSSDERFIFFTRFGRCD